MTTPAVITPLVPSTFPDTGDPTRFGPTAWNTGQKVTGGVIGDLLLRDPASSSGVAVRNPGWVDVRDYGAVGNGVADDTTAIQSAVSTGKPVSVPAGTYIVTSPILFQTGSVFQPGVHLQGAGKGITIFDNRVASGSCFRIESTTANRFMWGTTLSGFTIKTTSVHPAASSGITIKAVWGFGMSDVEIDNLTGDAFVIECLLGDTDASVQVALDRCHFKNCTTGRGIFCNVVSGHSEVGYLTCRNCAFESNDLGVYLRATNSVFTGCAFFTNTNATRAGMYVPYLAGNVRCLTLIGCTFENNRGRHLDIETCQCGLLQNCEFVSSAPSLGPITEFVNLGGAGGSVSHVTFANSFLRVVPTSAGFTTTTGFKIASDCQYVTIADTRWDDSDSNGTIDFDELSRVRFNDLGIHTRRNDDGYDYVRPDAFLKTNVAGGGSYTPDLRRYKVHYVTVTSTGLLTVNTPTNPTNTSWSGTAWRLIIINGSGGVITASIGGLIFQSGFVAPTNGQRTSAWFDYDSSKGHVQATPWMTV